MEATAIPVKPRQRQAVSSPRIGSQATADGGNHDPLKFTNATRLHPSIPAA